MLVSYLGNANLWHKINVQFGTFMECCTRAHVFIHRTLIDWEFISAYNFIYVIYPNHYHHQHNHLELSNKAYVKSELKFKTASQYLFVNNLFKIFQRNFDMLRGVARPLRMGPISCPSTSATKYQSTDVQVPRISKTSTILRRKSEMS
jgi:hypothetical protein